MKVAIVGTTINLSDNEDRDMRQYIALTLQRHSTMNTIVMSGGAKGVDTMAIEIAKGLGFLTKIIKPEVEDWNDVDGKIGYKTRNLKLAKECDKLYCFSVPVRKTKCFHHKQPQNHEKTAGCWTANKVLEDNKPVELIILERK
jgi:hypothetical protein